jgi:hypothetical protein
MTEFKVSDCPPAYQVIEAEVKPLPCRKRCGTDDIGKWVGWSLLAMFIFGMFAFPELMLSIAGMKNSTKGGEAER